MTPFEKFLTLNRIKKKDIADYLGICSSNIAVYCGHNARMLPQKHVTKIKNNTNGWNCAPFDEPGPIDFEYHSKSMKELLKENDQLQEKIVALEQIIANQSAVITSYERMIREFIKGN